jgi:hypothetical protein
MDGWDNRSPTNDLRWSQIPLSVRGEERSGKVQPLGPAGIQQRIPAQGATRWGLYNEERFWEVHYFCNPNSRAPTGARWHPSPTTGHRDLLMPRGNRVSMIYFQILPSQVRPLTTAPSRKWEHRVTQPLRFRFPLSRFHCSSFDRKATIALASEDAAQGKLHEARLSQRRNISAELGRVEGERGLSGPHIVAY